MRKALCALPDEEDHSSGGTEDDDNDVNKNEDVLPSPWDGVMNPPPWNPEE